MAGKELQKISKQETAFNRIKQFMTEGDICLTGEEELIFHRWNYAYKLYMQKKYTEDQIVDKVASFGTVSSITARNDIYHAQALFGGSIKSNKKFLLHHHAEDIRLFMEKCKVDKSLVHLVPKLADAYTKAIMAMPEEINKDVMPPPIMNFFLVPGQDLIPAKSFDEAIAEMRTRQDKEYTDYELIKNDPK